jgi:hypothetical protein
MNVILLMEKWCDLNPTLGDTSAVANLLGSLCSAGINVQLLHYDEYLVTNNSPIDPFLVECVKSNKIDALAVSYYPYHDYRNVNLSTFYQVKELGVPVIFIWFDFVHAHIRDLALQVSHAATLNVVVDTYQQPNDKFLPMWVPQDERIFFPGDIKEHNISFVGSRNGYGERHHYLNHLFKNGVHVTISGGQREHRLTIDEYADLLRKSKVSLNFPTKPDGCVQAKSRIYESMLCGALLMERTNDAITKWFTPMEHYVPFNNETDLLGAIEYYLKNDEARNEIVTKAFNKMKSDYNSFQWWNTVINKAVENL